MKSVRRCSQSLNNLLLRPARLPRRLLSASFLARASPFSRQEQTCASCTAEQRLVGLRNFLERIHAVLNALDAAPFVTIAAVHGVCFGGGLELALACDIIIADKMARFAFPELRLGLIPGFGGIPRLKRDLGNAFVRDLFFTGRTVNATRAQAVGLVAQLAGEGEALRIARSTAAQITKFDAVTRAAAKKFIKPVPHDELRREIELFCELFARPAVMAALKKFVEDSGPMPYLP
jgi:enoyl-CoA hydratase/carnithine racemase